MYFNTRPAYFPPTKMERLIDLLSLAGIIFTVLLIAIKWNQLPPEIVTHYNAQGDPDQWGPKINLLFMPLVQVLMVWIPMTWVRRFPNASPTCGSNRRNDRAFGWSMQTGWLKLAIIIFLALVSLYCFYGQLLC